MIELVEFILKKGGKGTDYQIIVTGVNLIPFGVKLKVNFLPEIPNPGSSVDVNIP